jgi:hypothetical protein
MYRRLGAICQNRKSLINYNKIKSFHYIYTEKCCRRNPTRKIIISKTRFRRFFEMGVREPVWGRRELVSHHGATGGGVRGPKMRHLVLYKLAGFFPTDWQPIGRELCPQKRCQKCAFSCTIRSKMHAFRLGKCKKGGFLQGGGATFWQAKNGGFWGPGGCRAGRVATRESFTFSCHSMQASLSL